LKETTPTRRTGAKNPRNRSNDFYVLSFDNELSETESAHSTSASSSSSSSSLSLSKQSTTAHGDFNEEDDDDDMDDDDDNTNNDSKSINSTATINQSSATSSSAVTSSKQRLGKSSTSSLDSSTRQMTAANRDRLVEYLFLDEDNHRMYMDDTAGLSDFLAGLDRLFRELNIKTSRMRPRELGALLDQIVDMYEDVVNPGKKQQLLKVTQNQMAVNKETIKPSVLVNENEAVDSVLVTVDNSKLEDTTPTTNLTTFPVYNGNDSFNSSTDSITTNSQAVDSGIESTKDFASRQQVGTTSHGDEIGPFLNAILGRLEGMLSNSLEVNLIITALIARLAHYHHNLIRSFLLDSELSLHPNVKSLVQVLGGVRLNIETNSKNCNNFSLLYLKAKLHLIKRLVSKTLTNHQQSLLPVRDTKASTSPVVVDAVQATAVAVTKKKSSSPFNMDKLLRKFFNKSTTVEVVASSAAPTQPTVYRNESFGLDSIGFAEQSDKLSPRARTVSTGRAQHQQSADFVLTENRFSSLSPQAEAEMRLVFFFFFNYLI
jgi:hypothetical protein